MAGLGDGILANGVLADGSNDITIACGTPGSIAATVLTATPSIAMSVSVGVGTCEATLSVNSVSIALTGSVTIGANLVDALVLSVKSATVDIVSVSNVTIGVNPIDLTMSSLAAAYVGEIVVVGIMSAAITASQPNITFSARRPSMSITVH